MQAESTSACCCPAPTSPTFLCCPPPPYACLVPLSGTPCATSLDSGAMLLTPPYCTSLPNSRAYFRVRVAVVCITTVHSWATLHGQPDLGTGLWCWCEDFPEVILFRRQVAPPQLKDRWDILAHSERLGRLGLESAAASDRVRSSYWVRQKIGSKRLGQNERFGQGERVGHIERLGHYKLLGQQKHLHNVSTKKIQNQRGASKS